MFAVSENICIFVLRNIVKATKSNSYIQNRNNKAGFLRQFYFGSLAVFRKQKGSLASLIINISNFYLKMRNTEKVSSTKVNNSNLSAQSTHKFRIRITSYLKFINGVERTYTLDKEVDAVSEYEATGKVLKELYKLMPAGNVPLSSMFGAKSCVQLD